MPRTVVQTIEQSTSDDWEAIGDPTEAALQAYAWKARLSKPELVTEATASAPLSFKMIQEFAFDATIKRMSVVYLETTQNKNDLWVYAVTWIKPSPGT